MCVFDMYLDGNMNGIKWNFNSKHLNERLKLNRLNMSYLKDIILNEGPNFHFPSDQSQRRYVAFYDAPENKDYDEIKVIFHCSDDRINVITVMPLADMGYEYY